MASLHELMLDWCERASGDEGAGIDEVRAYARAVERLEGTGLRPRDANGRPVGIGDVILVPEGARRCKFRTAMVVRTLSYDGSRWEARGVDDWEGVRVDRCRLMRLVDCEGDGDDAL